MRHRVPAVVGWSVHHGICGPGNTQPRPLGNLVVAFIPIVSGVEMTYSPSEPIPQRVRQMLDAVRSTPTVLSLAASGFDIDMSDTDQATAVVLHILYQLQVLDATTRMLAGLVQRLKLEIEGSEQLFV